MFGNIALDIVLGLVFVYLLYSLLATIIQEIIAQLLDLRARMLLKAVRILLEDRSNKEQNSVVRFLEHVWNNLCHFFMPFKTAALTKVFYQYPTIKYLTSSTWRNKVSYLSAATFAQVIIEMLRGVAYNATEPQMNAIYETLFVKKKIEVRAGSTVEEVELPVETLSQLQQLYINAQKDIDRFRALVENWFNGTVNMSSEWFKRQTQVILLVIGFAIAITFNVDSIAIANLLAHDDDARKDLVALAINTTPKYDSMVAKMAATTHPDTIYRTFVDSATSRIDTIKLIKDTIWVSWSNKELDDATKIVRGDIDKVNSILGLGWSDKDSCRRYDSVKALVTCNCLDSAAKDSTHTQLKRYQAKYHCEGNPYQKEGLVRILGWLLTALALSLGAPFWFDLLNKIIKLRTAVTTNSPTNTTEAKDNKSGPDIKPVG